MPKYKIGDRFMLHGDQREIAFVHEPSLRYVILYENYGDGEGADFVTEDYIDELYTKIEPFFEAGKTYTWDPRKVNLSPKREFFVESLLSPKQALAKRFVGGEFEKYVILDESAFGMMELDD